MSATHASLPFTSTQIHDLDSLTTSVSFQVDPQGIWGWIDTIILVFFSLDLIFSKLSALLTTVLTFHRLYDGVSRLGNIHACETALEDCTALHL